MAGFRDGVPAATGFQGSVAGLDLADLIQMKAAAAFSGCVDVRCGGGSGRLFFRAGQVVHAVTGDREGPEAFYAILRWTAGVFTAREHIETARVTIRMGTTHLLMEAMQLRDEQAAGRSPAAAPPPAPPRSPAGSLVERLRELPGIRQAVLARRDGGCVQGCAPVGEALAGQGQFLAHLAERLNTLLHLGALSGAMGYGEQGNLIHLCGRDQSLTVLADHHVDLAAVSAAVRGAYRAARGRPR